MKGSVSIYPTTWMTRSSMTHHSATHGSGTHDLETHDSAQHSVFVYGTLMFREVRFPLIGPHAEPQSARLQGYARYEAKIRSRCNFPAIIQHAEQSVQGLLIPSVSDRALSRLDWFEDIEGELYLRREVLVQLETGKEQIALVYVSGPALERRLLEPYGRSWEPNEFRSSELELYLDRYVLPAIREPSVRPPHAD